MLFSWLVSLFVTAILLDLMHPTQQAYPYRHQPCWQRCQQVCQQAYAYLGMRLLPFKKLIGNGVLALELGYLRLEPWQQVM